MSFVDRKAVGRNPHGTRNQEVTLDVALSQGRISGCATSGRLKNFMKMRSGYDFSWAWVGRDFSAELLARYFTVILSDYNPEPKLLNNTVPMFLALGRYDYAVPFSMWDGVKTRIPRLASHLFDRSGHFPMFEEPMLFDERLIAWLDASR